MKLLFVLGSRGEWGYIRPIIELAKTRGHEAAIWACNMSVLDRFGNLVDEIIQEGYPVVGKALTAGKRRSEASRRSVAIVSAGVGWR